MYYEIYLSELEPKLVTDTTIILLQCLGHLNKNNSMQVSITLECKQAHFP